jgi:ssDNA-binding Zn-finger/Zn-ribbon topoisomerase 1
MLRGKIVIMERNDKQFNILYIRCPFCSTLQRICFRAHGGYEFCGSDSGVKCKKCKKGFVIEIDVRQNIQRLRGISF